MCLSPQNKPTCYLIPRHAVLGLTPNAQAKN